ADMGIRGYGKTLEEAFENGAKAVFSIMVNIDKVEPKEKVEIKVSASDKESLFIEWLNFFISKVGIDEMVYSKFKVEKIYKEGDEYKLTGHAFGEKLDQKKHNPKIEVKAATYYGLKIGEKEGKKYVQCVVDV
ncbi:MAG: archease, partial [Methanosarcinales archaeon]